MAKILALKGLDLKAGKVYAINQASTDMLFYPVSYTSAEGIFFFNKDKKPVLHKSILLTTGQYAELEKMPDFWFRKPQNYIETGNGLIKQLWISIFNIEDIRWGVLPQKKDSLVVINNDHEGLTIFYPQYKSIDLVYGASSPEEDKKVIFCCPAAFTGETIPEFKHSNIAGHHVSNGKFEKGYACRHNTGAFVWYNGKWKFALKNYASEIKKAADSSGMAFAQNMIIHNFEEQSLVSSSSHQYRALCELDGKLCIIQSNQSIAYRTFVDMLKEAKVKHALYLDMEGWNHSWYRKWKNSEPTFIHNNRHDYYTNWLTFYL